MSRKLSKEEYTLIRRNILKKLYAHGAFRAGHLLFERLQSSIPRHLAGFVGGVLGDLVKEGLVCYYGRTKHGDAYQLNMHRLREIEQLIFISDKI